MSDEKPGFDFLKFGGLRRKPKRDPKYAGFNRRMMAATIDSMLLIPATPLVNAFRPIHFSALPPAPDPANEAATQQWVADVMNNEAFIGSVGANWGLQVLLLCAVSVVCWHVWGATPGKMLLRMKVVDATTEEPISLMQGMLRACGYIASGMSFFLGFFWIGIDKKRRAWHDLLADTVVITLPWRTPKQEVQP